MVHPWWIAVSWTVATRTGRSWWLMISMCPSMRWWVEMLRMVKNRSWMKMMWWMMSDDNWTRHTSLTYSSQLLGDSTQLLLQTIKFSLLVRDLTFSSGEPVLHGNLLLLLRLFLFIDNQPLLLNHDH